MVCIVFTSLFSLSVFQLSYGASFDCRKTSTLAEQAICSDPRLSNLDKLLGVSYKKALEMSTEKNALNTV